MTRDANSVVHVNLLIGNFHLTGFRERCTGVQIARESRKITARDVNAQTITWR